MSSSRFLMHAAVAIAALTGASLAQAELPRLEPKQVLGPTEADIEREPIEPQFGADVVIKGNLALVGIPNFDAGAGRAALFLRNAAGQWIRVVTFSPSDPRPGARFGRTVAISGRHALIGSETEVYVFQDVAGSGWRQRQKLAFGRAVIVSDIDFEGALAVVGVGRNTATTSGQNGAHVFALRSDGLLRPIVRLRPSDVQTNDRFGAQVALSASTVAITAPDQNSAQGAAYVYTCLETGCRLRQKLLANDGEQGDRFGSSVDVLGSTLVVGAEGADGVFGDPEQDPSEENFTASGAGYVFLRSPTRAEWVETQKLRITPQEHNSYLGLGSAVALSTDRIVISAPGGSSRFDPGEAFVYKRSGGQYAATHVMIGDQGFGANIGLSGTTAILGSANARLSFGRADIFALPQ